MADMDLRLETAGLERAMDMAEEWSNSTPAFLVTRTAQRIVKKTIAYTPCVSQGTIDTELAVTYSPGKTPTGRLSKQKKNRVLSFGMESNTERFDQPLAILIQLARMAPGSNYNALTNNLWRLPAGFEMLKGLDAAGRQAVLQELATRMTKSRHSSTHFLIAGWASAARKIYNLLGSYIRGDSGAPPLDDGFSDKAVSPKPNMSDLKYLSDSGSAQVSVGNMIGMIDATVNGSNAENYNKALSMYGIQPLQRAIDEVAVEMTKHYMKKDMAEMAQAFNAIR